MLLDSIPFVMFYNNQLTQKGIILELGGGVARVSGLTWAGAGEMVILGENKIKGMVLSLEKNNASIVIFGNDRELRQGDWVISTGVEMSVPVGYKHLGTVIDPLGNSLNGVDSSWLQNAVYTSVDAKAAGLIQREPVSEPLQTGIQIVDSLIPIGCGQRELIIGDRQTGKSTIALDAIINQTRTNTGVYWIYVAIGQKRAGIVYMFKKLQRLNCAANGLIVLSSSDDPAALQYLAPYSGCTIGEWFANAGAKVLIIYDDLSKQAVAYRQLSLLLRRPPGREAFPGDVFYLHSRLLERAAKLHVNRGGGSLTAFPVVETQAGDVSAFIPTNVISITDGQIYLDREIFNKGVRPAINVGISVSRVGSKAQVKTMKSLSGKLGIELAQFKEIEVLMKFGSALDKTTLLIMERGLRLTELLKQPHSQPLSVKLQVLYIFTGIFGYLDSIPVSEVSTFKAWLVNFVNTTNIFHKFNTNSDLSEKAFSNFLTEAVKEFKKQ